jgi:hypothetical protein
LIGGAVRPFKIRALTAMLCWDHALDPFKGRVLTAFCHHSLYANHVRAEIEARLPDASAVIVNFCLEAIDAGATAPDDARDLYNQCIPKLLEHIQDASLGDELFERFDCGDLDRPNEGPEQRSRFTVADYAFFVRGLS